MVKHFLTLVFCFLLWAVAPAATAQQVLCNLDFPDTDRTVILKVKPEVNPFAEGVSFWDDIFFINALYLSPNNVLKTNIYTINDDRKQILYSGEHIMLCSSSISVAHFGSVTVFAQPYFKQMTITCWVACGSP